MLNKHIALIVACCALPLLAACSDKESQANVVKQEKAIEIVTMDVTPVTLTDTLTLPGETSPDKDVCVSSESTGTVIWLNAKEGEEITKGSLIARLDVASSGARFDKAKAAKKFAAEQLRRRQMLLKKGVLAQEEYDQIQAELAKTEASLKEMQVNVEYGIVRAPISGMINKRYIDQGERLEAGAKVVDIVDSSIIRTTINVPEMDIPYIKKGQEVSVTVDAIPGKTWKGMVDFVSFKADKNTKTFEVRILTDNTDGTIRAGMLARVSLLRRTVENAITTPLFAIINQGGERLVYVEEDGLARARTVKLGIIEGDKAQVLEGLRAGDKLIVAGHTLVEDGMKVFEEAGAQKQ